MTRKRFVKLAMSHGCDRNLANALAKICIKHDISYDVASTPLLGHAVRGVEGLARYFFWFEYKITDNET